MPLTAPVLDDRRFQDIVDEAKKRIPHYCKEWTDHNVSDPGVTLLELFAWMTELLIYRQNQVPERHQVKFLELLGITLREPVPARVPVTFWLSAPQEIPVTIPKGTEVASTQTETERSILFSTDDDLVIEPPELAAIMNRVAAGDRGKKSYASQNLRRLAAGFEGFEVFTAVPQVDDALYFGFENDLSNHVLRFEFDFDPAFGAGIDPSLPPYLWEASTGLDEPRWQPCDLELDTTRGMNSGGRMQIHLPAMGSYTTNRKTQYWVRLRIKEVSAQEQQDGMRPYQETPRLRQVSVVSLGGRVQATHARVVHREFLGQSDGSPGQRFSLKFTPVLERTPAEVLVVQQDDTEEQPWEEVRDFADSGPQDRHYTLDGISGEVRLGPAVRQQDGTIKLYGAIPPRGANLVVEQYRVGGGQQGNVQAGVLNTLKTAIPYVSRVANREAAWGGLDAETLDSAKMRAPALLRSRDRAVTEADYEYLASQAMPAEIGRVKCLQPRPAEAGRVSPGQIYVLVIPRLPQPEGILDPQALELSEPLVEALTAYLDERRMLTARFDVRPPAYHWVSARVSLRAAPGAAEDQVEAAVLARLYRFLNPLTGGVSGRGWPFGRDLFEGEVYQALQGMEDVLFVRNVELFNAAPGGEGQGDPLELVEVLAHGVIASGQHEVAFV